MIHNKVIYKDLIFLNQNIQNKDYIIDFIIDNAKQKGYLTDGVNLKKAIVAREEEVSTSIGFNIAMPHGKSEEVTHPFIAFLRSNEEFHWDENDDKVRLILLIAVPLENEGNFHLKIISQISKKLLDENFRTQLLTENDIDKVYDLLSSINQ